jgi:hypothetical protein
MKVGAALALAGEALDAALRWQQLALSAQEAGRTSITEDDLQQIVFENDQDRQEFNAELERRRAQAATPAKG